MFRVGFWLGLRLGLNVWEPAFTHLGLCGGGSWRKGGRGVLSYCFGGCLAEEGAWGVGVFEVGFERGVR